MTFETVLITISLTVIAFVILLAVAAMYDRIDHTSYTTYKPTKPGKGESK